MSGWQKGGRGQNRAGVAWGGGGLGLCFCEEQKRYGGNQKREMKRTGICKIKLVECFCSIYIFPIFHLTQYFIFAFVCNY